MATEFLPVNWNLYHTLAQNLAATILTQKESPDEIVAISRGGLTLGHLLTDFLHIPISTIAIQSYVDIQSQGELTITIPLQKSIKGKRVILVDDVADSGKTLLRAVEHLKESDPLKITTVTMFYKPRSSFKPDYFAQETTKWILFPYEPTEMIQLLTTQMEKEGKSQEEVNVFLKQLEYSDDQIAFVRKYYDHHR